MHKYEGYWEGQGIRIPVSFTVENGRLDNFQPPALEEALYGAALLAHLNYQNLLKGIVERLPTNIDVRKAA